MHLEATKQFVTKLGKTIAGRRTSRLHRQSHPAADDQRGDLRFTKASECRAIDTACGSAPITMGPLELVHRARHLPLACRCCTRTADKYRPCPLLVKCRGGAGWPARSAASDYRGESRCRTLSERRRSESRDRRLHGFMARLRVPAKIRGSICSLICRVRLPPVGRVPWTTSLFPRSSPAAAAHWPSPARCWP